MRDLIRLTAAALAEKIHSREVSAVEVAQAHLDRIAAVDGAVHAFLHVAAESALQSAALAGVLEENLQPAGDEVPRRSASHSLLGHGHPPPRHEPAWQSGP